MKKEFELKDVSDDTVLTLLDHHASKDTISIHLSSEYEDIEWGICLSDKSVKQLIKQLKLHLKAKSITKVKETK
jgi:hypothetical protein